MSSLVTMNALFTRTSRRPCSSSTRRNSASTASSSRWSRATATPVPPAAVDLVGGGTDRAGQRVVGLAHRPRGDVDGRAGGTELERAALADAAARTGDDRHPAVERAHALAASPSQTRSRAATSSSPTRRRRARARPAVRRPRSDRGRRTAHRRRRRTSTPAASAPTTRRPCRLGAVGAGELAPRAHVEGPERERQVERVAGAPDRRLPVKRYRYTRVAARFVTRAPAARSAGAARDRRPLRRDRRRTPRTRRAPRSSSVMPRLAALPAR